MVCQEKDVENDFIGTVVKELTVEDITTKNVFRTKN